MKKGTAVNFNGGKGKEDLLALVRGGTGDHLNVAAFEEDGVKFYDNVPRRDPSDYEAGGGGGRTWYPIA